MKCIKLSKSNKRTVYAFLKFV
uniref:Uncharacterized protein n=1 Tax=Anguilla anguilla TaxID=7936 RepID=A0A0E9VZM6_ANGAN